MKRLIVVLSAVAVFVLGMPMNGHAASTNLIANGSFERPETNSFTTYAKGSHQIPGWQITIGTVDIIGSNWQPASGKQSLDLDGTPGPGGIAQSFATVPGLKYTLTFALAGNPECAPTMKKLLVKVAGVRKRYTFDASHTSDSAMGWRRISLEFTANAKRTTLAFISLDARGLNCGPALDAIAVEGSSAAVAP